MERTLLAIARGGSDAPAALLSFGRALASTTALWRRKLVRVHPSSKNGFGFFELTEAGRAEAERLEAREEERARRLASWEEGDVG